MLENLTKVSSNLNKQTNKNRKARGEVGGTEEAKSCSLLAWRQAANVITAAFLHKQNLGELRDLLSEGHALPKEHAKPSLQVGHSRRVTGTELSQTCSNLTAGT